MSNFVVCLDIDETLIHSTEERVSERQHRLGNYWTFERPGLRNFLISVSSFSEIGIYTAAGQTYAERFVDMFMTDIDLKFLLSGNRCVKQPWRQNYEVTSEDYIKDLNKVVKSRSELARLIAVDDKPYLYPRQYGNVVGVRAYDGRIHDDTLPNLARYLKYLSSLENVRNIEKRGWMSKYNSDYNMS